MEPAEGGGFIAFVFSAVLFLLFVAVFCWLLWKFFCAFRESITVIWQRIVHLGKDPLYVELDLIRAAKAEGRKYYVFFGSVVLDSDMLYHAPAVATPPMAEAYAKFSNKLGPNTVIVEPGYISRAAWLVSALCNDQSSKRPRT